MAAATAVAPTSGRLYIAGQWRAPDQQDWRRGGQYGPGRDGGDPPRKCPADQGGVRPTRGRAATGLLQRVAGAVGWPGRRAR